MRRGGPVFMFYAFLFFVFVLGAVVGSGLNVCAYRLPYEKSILWPGSRCGHCLQPVRWYDNVPLVSYWLLRGRCRSCGAPFSMRYFFVELFTGLAFAGLFYLEVAQNALNLEPLQGMRYAVVRGWVPAAAWCAFVYHALLLSFLIAASLCDLDHMEIPLSITMTGAAVGLVGSMIFPWSWPGQVPLPPQVGQPMPLLPAGIYPWPVWYPLPPWLPAGSWQLGLATGLAGALAGTLVLRTVRSLFGFGRGIEGLGLGDADLMMMAGAFIGWQPIVVALFVGVVPGLFFAILQLLRRGGQAMPFGPPLAIGVLITLLTWPHIGARYQALFFDPVLLAILAGFGGLLLLITSFALRLLRGTPEQAV